MAVAKRKPIKYDVEEEIKAEPEEEIDRDSFYYFRLDRAGMFVDDISGLNLNNPAGVRQGKVRKGLDPSKYERVRLGLANRRIKQVDPRFPEVSESLQPTRKDLKKTREAQILATKQKPDILLDLFDNLGSKKAGKGVLPLKIFHWLEVGGHNYVLRPRPEIVDAIEAQLKVNGVTDFRIKPEDEEGILVVNMSTEEYVTNM